LKLELPFQQFIKLNLEELMQPLRQGDVLISPLHDNFNLSLSHHLPHLVLAEGEATGHRHQISQGKAELYQQQGQLYLKVISETATLTHEEHHAVKIPRGTWLVRRQREYQQEGWRYVGD
jgi:hypothetical protein